MRKILPETFDLTCPIEFFSCVENGGFVADMLEIGEIDSQYVVKGQRLFEIFRNVKPEHKKFLFKENRYFGKVEVVFGHYRGIDFALCIENGKTTALGACKKVYKLDHEHIWHRTIGERIALMGLK